MRILITGASGFIGQALVAHWHGRHEVHGMYETALSTGKNPQLDPGRQHVCTLTDHAGLDRLVADVQPEVVVHLAARSEVALSFTNYLEVSQVNYVGAVALAEACRRHVDGFRLFVQASTMETYGHHPAGRPFTEDTPQYPMAPYAVAKVAVEKYLAYMAYAYQFPATVLRQTNCYGRTDNDFFIVERIISQMLAGPVCNLGDPAPRRNFLHISDLVALYDRVLERVGVATGQTFVTGPDNALSIRDLAAQVVMLLDWRGTIHWRTIPKRPGEIYYLNSRPDKAAEMLGWEPKVGLWDGLARTIQVWRDKARVDA